MSPLHGEQETTSGAPVQQELEPADGSNMYKRLRNQLHDNELSGGLFLVPVPSPATAGSQLPAKKQKPMKFRYDDDLGELRPSFLSIWSPETASSSDPSKDKLLGETAMAKLPFQALKSNISRDDEQEGIALMKPSTRVYECKICHERFPTFQALGGHTTGHMKSKLSNKHEAGRSTSSTPPATAARCHECSICGKCFPSGQALGGHKSLHRDKKAGRMQHEETGTTRSLGSNNLDFDLNEPPPPPT